MRLTAEAFANDRHGSQARTGTGSYHQQTAISKAGVCGISLYPDRRSVFETVVTISRDGVEYVLVGDQAVLPNGFFRATEDVDVFLKPGRNNGEKIIRALTFLPASSEMDTSWQGTGKPCRNFLELCHDAGAFGRSSSCA